MSKFETAGDIRAKSRNILDNVEYINKKDLYKILDKVFSRKGWNAYSYDEMKQEIKEELERSK